MLAIRTGLEPATTCVTGKYSNQLNYRISLFFLFIIFNHSKIEKEIDAIRTGLEPATTCVTGKYSNQLNYRIRKL